MQLRLSIIFLITLFTAAGAFLLPSHSKAQSLCKDLMVGELKQDFEIAHNNQYTKEVSQSAIIKDQCGLGTCHLQAWSAHLEMDFQRRTGQKIQISTEYLAARHWEAQALQLLSRDKIENDDRTVDIKLGSNLMMSQMMLRSYGLMPAQKWTGGVAFQKEENVKKLQMYLSNIIARTKWNVLHETNPNKKLALLEEGRNQIREIFRHMLGPEVKDFNFLGESYTPKDFAKKFFPEVFRSIIVVKANRNPKSANTYFELSNGKYIEASVSDMARMIKALVDKDQSVLLSYDHNGAFVDRRTGVMSVSAFNVPPWAMPLSPDQKSHFERKANAHAIQITAYDESFESGDFVKFKSQNSWGTAVGDRGSYHMYYDFFERMVESIVFYEDSGIELPKANLRQHKNQSFDFN